MSNYLFIRSFTKIDFSKIVAKKVVVFLWAIYMETSKKANKNMILI